MSVASRLFDFSAPAVRTDAVGYTHAKYAQYTRLSQHIYTQILQIFDAFELPYYLFAGSALGYVRNGTMLPWIDDLDVILFEEHIPYFEAEVVPFLKACGFNCFAPRQFQGGGFHILAMQQGGKRDLTIPFSDGTDVSVPWAQVDVFYTTVDENGFLRNPRGWGLYDKKDVPADWVAPGVEVELEGWKTRLFSKYEEDILKEYGDVLNNVVVASHGRVFLNRPNMKWDDFEADFRAVVAETTAEHPPCCDAGHLQAFTARPGQLYMSEPRQSFDAIVAQILQAGASELHLAEGDQTFWVMDLKRLFPSLRIRAVFGNEREAYRAVHLRSFIDDVSCEDPDLLAKYEACLAQIARLDQGDIGAVGAESVS
ncbi:LicD family protein [Phaeobacter gallaeciensis]|uniref:LicD family protein n=1 Tax=Phaeobacter gallaeciensis TaxID=60890 RepID=UPI00237F654A|nr:LicD family protein [Phaeobacter gallaeciensis]MDE4306141.1 LicD family protein [Phaeobacter gallaeciensis]MDE4310563.1 LicD family protein [Phaeobacter gallaeciensis]MDE4315023.1 LicD family protein [Phaeobacter gallaeciensis]MDE4319500.1 LicD family protein [Phaeobacter gallaeciensis]MDE4323880.1 LicD family protein [Phaeobacter gallaeciensis]